MINLDLQTLASRYRAGTLGTIRPDRGACPPRSTISSASSPRAASSARAASCRPAARSTVELRGFLCEGYAARGAEDISEPGGWRAYVARAARPTA